MSDWTGGYVSGIDYLYDFQPEAAPYRVQLSLLSAGLVPPKIGTACELGFGQGVGVNVHAAAHAARWWGTDFNPAQVGFARELAESSGAELHLYDQSFAEFCARDDLPEFDFVVMHGVWSWVSEDNRAVIVDFLRRKLAVGGVAYLSYNVQPGFAALGPLHPLLFNHAAALGRGGEALPARLDAALAFAERVLALSPAFAAAHPQLPEQLRAIRREDQRYLAHEYLNANWTPTSFTRVAESLSAAKLQFACSPGWQRAADGRELAPEQQSLLAEIGDVRYREVVRDLMLNRSFRIDYWVKGARRLAPLERIGRMLEQRVMLIRQPDEVLAAAARTVDSKAVPDAVLAALTAALADHQPRLVSEIEDMIAGRGVTVAQLCEAVGALVRLDAVAPVQEGMAVQAARARTDRLNAQLCAKALQGADVRVLASPVTGTGFSEVGGRVALFFVNAVAHGLRDPQELGGRALQIFRSLGIGLFRDGRPIESTEECLGLLSAQARYFLERQLPALRAMQIVG